MCLISHKISYNLMCKTAVFHDTSHSLPETRVHALRIYENVLERYQCLLDICIKVNHYLKKKRLYPLQIQLITTNSHSYFIQ